MRKLHNIFLMLILLNFVCAVSAWAQGTAFTYQGKLTDGGAGANGQFDFTFKLYPAQTSPPGQTGSDIVRLGVPVTGGIFTVTLDFGASPFTTTNPNLVANYLEVWVKPGGSTGGYTQLLPRAQITSSPYAVQTINARSADALSASCTGCVTSAQIGSVSGSAVTSPIPVSSVPDLSASYIRNGPPSQQIANSNISGDGIFGGSVAIGTAPSLARLTVSASTANPGNNTAQFEASSIGPNFSHIHFGTTGDWYIRSAANTGKVVLQDSGGNVGIGTTAPLFKFHVRTGTDQNFAFRPGTDFSGTLSGVGLQSVNDTNTAYQPLDLEGSQLTMNVASGGRVGIGTPTPSARLNVVGGGFAQNVSISDSNATATTLDLQNTSSSASWRFQSNGSADTNRSGNLEVWKVGGVNAMTIQPDGDIGIGTTNPTATLEVNGYTKLGSDAPSIRIKKLTGTTQSCEGCTAGIGHGLDASKILSISVMVNSSGPSWIGPSFTFYNNGHVFNWELGGPTIFVHNVLGASANILSRPIKILIVYEQ